MITRAVGAEPDVDVDPFAESSPRTARNLFLVPSDGLTDMVNDGTDPWT